MNKSFINTLKLVADFQFLSNRINFCTIKVQETKTYILVSKQIKL